MVTFAKLTPLQEHVKRQWESGVQIEPRFLLLLNPVYCINNYQESERLKRDYGVLHPLLSVIHETEETEIEEEDVCTQCGSEHVVWDMKENDTICKNCGCVFSCCFERIPYHTAPKYERVMNFEKYLTRIMSKGNDHVSSINIQKLNKEFNWMVRVFNSAKNAKDASVRLKKRKNFLSLSFVVYKIACKYGFSVNVKLPKLQKTRDTLEILWLELMQHANTM